MNTTSPEMNKNISKQNAQETTIYDELAEIAEQQKAEQLAEQQRIEEEALQGAENQEPGDEELVPETDPLSAEADAEQLSENEKYLSELMHHMKSQQPEIYQDALAQIAAEKSRDATELTSPEELDIELEERLSKQGKIPADLLEQMTTQLRGEELLADSTAWKEVNASGMVGDIARRWRDLYQKAMQEVLR